MAGNQTEARAQVRPRRADVQGLRAVAVLLVVAFHAGLPVPGGYGGVDVFFVISGFVIAGMLQREWLGNGRLRLGAFYLRRATRLLPASALVLLATLAGSAVVEAPFGAQQRTAQTARAAAVFAANLDLVRRHAGYFDRGTQTNPLLHLWSLGVEEQYYLLLPLAYLLWRGLRRLTGNGRLAAALLVGLGSAVSLGLYLEWALALARPWSLDPRQAAFFTVPARAWQFGLGMLLAVLPRPRAGRAAALLGAGALLAAAVAPRLPTPAVSLLAAAGAAALILGAPRLLTIRPLVRIGDVSYGWYLWHWPAIVLLGDALPDRSWVPLLAAAASYPLAEVTHRLLESPVRLRFPRRLVPVGTLAAVCLAGPAAAAASLSAVSNAAWHDPTLVAVQGSSAIATLGRRMHCLLGHDLAQPNGPCLLRPAGPSRGLVVLAGDSHADSLSDGVAAAARQLHLAVALRTAAACPLTPIGRWTNTQVGDCLGYDRRTLTAIHRLHPRLVVLAHSSVAYVQVLRDRGVPDPEQRWAASLAQTVRQLTAWRLPVLVVQDVPRIGSRPDPCRFGALLPLDCSEPRSAVAGRQGPVAQAERAALSGITGATVVDPTPLLCGPAACDPLRGHQLLYFDNQHLNSLGSLLLTPALRSWMAQAMNP